MTAPQTITQAYPPLPLAELIPAISRFPSVPISEKHKLIQELVDIHPTVNFSWGPGWRFRRARCIKTEENIPTGVDDIIWRKDGPVPEQRANPMGFQVLYLADRVNTALCEVNADGHIAVIAEFEISPGRNIQVAPIGELSRIQRTGRGFLLPEKESSSLSKMLNACAPDDATSLLITDTFLFECLTNAEDDYSVSSYVAKCIFDKLPSVSTIAYPSRRLLGAINFAVRVNDFWNAWGVRSVRCGSATHLACGYYSYTNIRHVDGISENGCLHWCNEADADGSALLLEPLWSDLSR